MNLFTAMKSASLGAMASLVLGVLLSACGGGGGNAGDPLLGGGSSGSIRVSELSIVLDRSSVPNNGSAVVTATVTALDANRVAVSNVPISFAVNAGGVVKPEGTSTNAKGELVATVEIGSDRSNRTITVTATSGAVSRTSSFTVIDSTTSEPKAETLSMLLDKRTINNSGTDAITVTVTAKGAGGNVLAGIPVTFAVDSNASVAPAGPSTNANGELTAVVKIGDDKANRVVNVVARSGLLTKTERFQVTGVKLQPTALPATVSPSTTGSVEYRVFDVNGGPIPNISVNVSAPGLPSVLGSTDDNGYYKYSYTAPATAGTLNFLASAAGVSVNQSVLVKGGATVIPNADKSVLSVPVPVSATPNVLKVNTTTTNNQSQIKAVFLAAQNTPIQNVRVRFDFNGSSNPNGSLSSGSDLVYSDAQGAAVTSYRAGATASPTNGVVLRACWDYGDFDLGACPNFSLVTLTTVAEGLSVTIGTDDTIEDGSTGLTYVKRYVVQVVDAAGNPVGSQEVTPTVDLNLYGKGRYVWNRALTAWVAGRYDNSDTYIGPAISCANEDANRNGALELGEDFNSNNVLDPRKSDVAVSVIGSTKTDSSGQAVVKLEYPKSHAGWVNATISVAADVRSPPATWVGWLPTEATAIKRETPPPAFVQSPYGQARSGSCAVAD